MSDSVSREQSPATELAAEGGPDEDSGPAPESRDRMSSRNSSAWNEEVGGSNYVNFKCIGKEQSVCWK